MKYQISRYQTKSQWNNIIEKADLAVDMPVYVIECLRPKLGFAYLSTWLQSELPNIPDEIIDLANKDEMRIVFHLYEWVMIDYAECLKLFFDPRYIKLDLKSVRVLVPVIPPYPDHLVEVCEWIRYFPSFWLGYHNMIKHTETVSEVRLDKRTKKITCLNRRTTPHRRYVVSKLLAAGLLDEGFVSLTGVLNKDPLYPCATTPAMLNELVDNIDMEALEKIAPLYVDETSPAEHNDAAQLQHNLLNDSYWNIVTETFNHNVVSGFVTEKTFKPIANLQPFVIIGTHKSLAVLKELGFRTFGRYIDESYDLIEDETKRLRAATTAALKLARMSHEQHIELMKKVKPILEHNRQHFYNTKAVTEHLERIIR